MNLSWLNHKSSLTGLVLALTGGLAWNLPGLLGPALSIFLVIGVSYATSRWSRFLSAFLYFLAGSWGIVPGAETFFGTGPETGLLGLILWFGSSAVLSLPWIWAGTARGIALALVLDAFPPLGLIGWLSPLSAAGVFSPDLEWLAFFSCCTGWFLTHGRIGLQFCGWPSSWR